MRLKPRKKRALDTQTRASAPHAPPSSHALAGGCATAPPNPGAARGRAAGAAPARKRGAPQHPCTKKSPVHGRVGLAGLRPAGALPALRCSGARQRRRATLPTPPNCVAASALLRAAALTTRMVRRAAGWAGMDPNARGWRSECGGARCSVAPERSIPVLPPLSLHGPAAAIRDALALCAEMLHGDGSVGLAGPWRLACETGGRLFFQGDSATAGWLQLCTPTCLTGCTAACCISFLIISIQACSHALALANPVANTVAGSWARGLKAVQWKLGLQYAVFSHNGRCSLGCSNQAGIRAEK